MPIQLAPISMDDREAVVDIFNYYIEHSNAAYPERPVPYEFFDMLMKMNAGYPGVVAKDDNSRVIGFGMLRAYNPMPAFAHTAEISYFIKPGYTGHGIGQMMLEHLISEAKGKGLRVILAGISSLNDGSIRFHQHHGFVECGRFQQVGKKNDQLFDVVWMQKVL